MPATGLPVGLTETGTEAKLDLGYEFYEYHPTYGERLWVYIQNSGNGALVAGELVSRKPSTATRGIGQKHEQSAAVAPKGCLGVAQHAIADGSYGFILKRGMGTVLADTGGISANTAIVPGDAIDGRLDSAPGTGSAADALRSANSVGWAHAAISATATGLAYIDCAG